MSRPRVVRTAFGRAALADVKAFPPWMTGRCPRYSKQKNRRIPPEVNSLGGDICLVWDPWPPPVGGPVGLFVPLSART